MKSSKGFLLRCMCIICDCIVSMLQIPSEERWRLLLICLLPLRAWRTCTKLIVSAGTSSDLSEVYLGKNCDFGLCRSEEVVAV